MKKLLTLTLSLLMAFSLCLTVSADEPVTVTVDSADGLLKEINTAATSGKETIIQLTNEIDTDPNNMGNGFSVGGFANITLDLNGNKLYTPRIEVSANLTIIDSKDVNHNGYGGGEIQLTKSTSADNHISVSTNVSTPATLTLESGLITLYSESDHTHKYVIYAGNNSKINISGGRIAGKEVPVGADNSDSVNITGGTFNQDVSAYLGEGCSIVYSTTYRNYVVYNQDTKPTVNEDTVAVAAMSEEAGSILNENKTKIYTYKDGEATEVTKDSSTQYTLIYEAGRVDSDNPELKALVGKVISDTSKFNYISMDIQLKAKNNDSEYYINEITNSETGESVKIPVTVYLSEEDTKNMDGKEIKVVRLHENKEGNYDVDSISPVTRNGAVLTFESDKFSTFVIAYGNSTSSGSGSGSSSNSSATTETTTTPTKTYDAKDKNKDGVVSCEEEMNSANWVWSTTKGACVYSVTNTSAK